MLAPASDTNIVGDYVTMTTLPSFVGTITEPNPALVPLAGQTAILDIGIAVVTLDGHDRLLRRLAQHPGRPAAVYPQQCRDGTHRCQRQLHRHGRRGRGRNRPGHEHDAPAQLALQRRHQRHARADPLPGTVSGYYVARVRVTDQSGNVSNPATAPFVVDTVPPVVTVASPANNSVINPSTAPLNFVVDASQNLDLTHFTTAQIQLLQSAPDGSFTGTGTTPSQSTRP